MIYIDNGITDPAFNLAAEEYLMKESGEDIFMLWQNTPCVIYGKHQDPRAEINLSLTREKGLPVLRRSSGGGTVYQDLGNFNLTFIRNGFPAFSPFVQLIQNFLQQLGLPVRTDTRNALFIGDKKISGSAQWVYKNRFLYHATLLFSADLALLSQVLTPSPFLSSGLPDKKVKSVKSPVTNLQAHLPLTLNRQEFRNRLSRYFIPEPAPVYEFSAQDVQRIRQLRKNYSKELI